MPLLVINADGEIPRITGGDTALEQALAALPPGAPIIVMIHGYRFSPNDKRENPHDHILSLSPASGNWKAVSWPRHLGFGTHRAEEGLCIAFGWDSLGTIWQAYAMAARAGQALARLLLQIDRLRPGTRVEALGHSLGARVILQALPHLTRPVLRRAILMAAAELRGPTEAALATPAGRVAEFINVTSRENDLYDFLIERLLPRARDRALGLGVSGRPNWLDLQLDHDDTLRALARLGHPIAPPRLRICHWSLYLRPGVFGLYRALLRDDLPLAALRAPLPETASPRWSRLLAPPRVTAGRRAPL